MVGLASIFPNLSCVCSSCGSLFRILYVTVGRDDRGVAGVAHQQRLAFGIVYVVVWCGAAVITANAALLGAKMSFFQSVCVLGYCLAPLDVAALLCFFVPTTLRIVKVLLCSVALVWATGASVPFISEVSPSDRQALAVYPVWLFYGTIAVVICVA
eukprot:GHVT01077750.1.p1 GENE.GHVT01077750.1~~GHVT01077750.1.p1  ORF type:complete len:156 (+),score=21.02 GHVT01077750.1:1298-1765(+)